MSKSLLILIISFCFSGSFLLGQNNVLTDRDYSVYNYLINREVNNLDSSMPKLDSMKIYLKYIMTIEDSTKGGARYTYTGIDTSDKAFTIQDAGSYYNINRKNFFIEKDKLIFKQPVGSEKAAKSKNVIIEFGKCLFYNDNKNAMVYYGITYGPLNGEGCMLILQNDGNTWKIIRKRTIWVS